MAAPYITAVQVGSYFVTQYYQMLQQRPDYVHQLYSDASTMIRVDGRNRDTASGMMQIHALVMSLRFSSIEIKTAHSLESWNGGVIIMVTGSVQMSDFRARKKFAQTFFLAPQEKGYFVINDIFHLIDEDQIHPYPATLLTQSNLDAAKLSVPPSISDSVPSYMVGGPISTREYMPAPAIKENGTADQFSLPEQRIQQQVQGVETVLEGTNADQVNGFFETPMDSVQEVPPPVEESVVEPQRHTYASILRVAKGQSVASAVGAPNKDMAPASEWQNIQQNNQPSNQLSQQLTASSAGTDEGFRAEASEEATVADDKGEIKSVYVRGLPPSLTVSEIEEEFEKFGKLGPAGVAIRRVKDTDVCYAFVEFDDMTGVQNAIQAGAVQVAGRQVYVEERRANSSFARGRRGRGRGSFQPDTSRGRFGGRSSSGRSGGDSRGWGNGNGNGYYRQLNRQDKGYSRNGQTQQEVTA